MQRREIAGVLLASAAGAALITKKAAAKSCTAPCFEQTAAEAAAAQHPRPAAEPGPPQ